MIGQRNIRRDIANDEDVESDRRMDQAHFHDDGHRHAEPDEVKAASAGSGGRMIGAS